MTSDSSYEITGAVFWQPSDYLLVSGGVQAYDGDTTPTGTMLSYGREFLQIDIGYRDHWLSPMSESAMLLSTEAASSRLLSRTAQREHGLCAIPTKRAQAPSCRQSIRRYNYSSSATGRTPSPCAASPKRSAGASSKSRTPPNLSALSMNGPPPL